MLDAEYYHEQEQRKRGKRDKRAASDFKYLLKDLDSSLLTEATSWESQVLPLVKKSDEYRSLDDPDLAREIFEKLVSRISEKRDSKRAREDDEESVAAGDDGSSKAHSKKKKKHKRKHGHRDVRIFLTLMMCI